MTTSSVSNSILTLQKINGIQDTTRLLDCVRSLDLSPELYNGEPTGRNVKWFGIQAEILDDGKSWRTFEATEPIEFWLFLTELKDQFYPEANSVAVCRYTGTESTALCIPGYNEQPIFRSQVILINLIDQPQKLQREKVSAQFRAENQKVPLDDGDVVAIDPVRYGRPPSGAQASPVKGKIASQTAAGANGYLIELRVLEM
ncbi:hypothetical protein Cri9333_0518 [Crinalium epipsammum PCC 9333]|uniref:Uncharacterized protein n=1 Tax=Crinalium epipsammum PCC 9333 TaxID=1173022 RepID=K9VU38_9CYAN|nr:hypothetical protein [Crinalium epipsammum]AFZ11476.1 hypothetical protein Cri9333_0518 [Crinalium epipsammum PCC 9333]